MPTIPTTFKTFFELKLGINKPFKISIKSGLVRKEDIRKDKLINATMSINIFDKILKLFMKIKMDITMHSIIS